jgi:hypothetical protein
VDAGTDAGWDSGTNGGGDSGTDAGTDAGSWDAGRDAGADAGWDAGSWDAGRDAGADASSGGGSWGDAGTDGGADAGAGQDGGWALRSALQAATPLVATPVLDTAPVTNAQQTNDYENRRMRERCGLCEVRPVGPVDPNKVPYILVHGINAGPDSMNPVRNNLPANAQVYQFYYPDNRHPMEVSDCLRNAIMQVRQQHRGSRLEVVAHSLGTVIATGADHSLADPEWMPTEVDTTCGKMRVRGRHRKDFVLEPPPGPGGLDLGMTLIEPIFQGYGDFPLFIANCMPGRGDLIAGSALMQTLNRKPRHSRNRRIVYADDPNDKTSKHLGDFGDDSLELICKMMRGERVRSRKFEMFNAWNALKNQPVANGQSLFDALGCGGCTPDRLRQLAGQTMEKRPGNHDSVLGNVPFPP